MEQGGGYSRPPCRYSEKFTGREEMPLDVKSLAESGVERQNILCE